MRQESLARPGKHALGAAEKIRSSKRRMLTTVCAMAKAVALFLAERASCESFCGFGVSETSDRQRTLTGDQRRQITKAEVPNDLCNATEIKPFPARVRRGITQFCMAKIAGAPQGDKSSRVMYDLKA